MSPLDILIFLFFILVTIQAATSCIEYWKGIEEDLVPVSVPRASGTRASLSKAVRTGRPSSVRVTPIKRVNTPYISDSSRICIITRQTPLKAKGAA